MEADKTVVQEQRRTARTDGVPVQRVVVTDVKMSFGSMVAFIVKWTIASIPALIILMILLAILSAVLSGVLRGLFGTL